MLEKISKAILLIAVVLLLTSWVDVLAHNDPVDGDYNYHPCNILNIAYERMCE